MPRKPVLLLTKGGILNLCAHNSLLNCYSKIECPICNNFKITKLPQHLFVSSRALMVHITKAHSIPKTEYKKIKRYVRIFEKRQEKSFLEFLKIRGILK